MADKKANLKSLFTNTRTRIIIVITIVLLLTAVIIGFVKINSAEHLGSAASVNLSGETASIESVPGALNPTVQYANLQEQQNVNQAQSALEQGSSAIPTIIRTQVVGQGVSVIGPQHGQAGVGFTTLAREDEGGVQQTLWAQNLKDASCSKAVVDKVVSQGAQISDLKKGCSCMQLHDVGYQFTDLQQVCSCTALKEIGVSATQLKDTGYSVARLRDCGFDACELRAAGFTAQQMKDGGFSDGELKGAGYPGQDIIRASGIPDGMTANDIRKAGCQLDALRKLHDAGVSASAIRHINGCSVNQLKAAGYSAEDLRNAGFTAADLAHAGFSPNQLKDAGYSARDLLNAGMTPAQLTNAGYSPDDVSAAENELPPGITPDQITQAGCNQQALENERQAGVSAVLIEKYAHCSAADLKAAGFTDDDLAAAGFTPKQIQASQMASDKAIQAAGCDPVKLRALYLQGVSAQRIHELNGCSAAALKAAGYDAKQLLDAGFTPQQLLAAGFTPDQIKNAQAASDSAIRAAGCDPAKLHELFLAGVSAQRIHQLNGCSAAALKAAGYDAKQLLDAGFTPQQLLAAGFTPDQIKNAQAASDSAIRAAGCDPVKLHELFLAGVSAQRIHELNGCSAAALKAAGYSAKDLMSAGFTPKELLAAGFTPEQLKQAQGLSDDEIRAAGLDPDKLHAFYVAGVSPEKIHRLNGASAAALKAAGYDAKSLIAAGFTPDDLVSAGFTPQDLVDAGIQPSAIIAAGRIHNCSAASLKTAYAQGVSAVTIEKTLGCSAAALKDAGYSAAQLKAAGFTAAELKAAGFSAGDLKAAGFSAKDLLNAGFTPSDLKAAGFTAKQLKDAGLTASALKAAGFSDADLQAAGVETSSSPVSSSTSAQLAATSNPQAFGSSNSQVAGLSNAKLPGANQSNVPAIPSIQSPSDKQAPSAVASTQQLQQILQRQNQQVSDQRYQLQIQQRAGLMLSAANQALQEWRKPPQQNYVGTPEDALVPADALAAQQAANAINGLPGQLPGAPGQGPAQTKALLKTGDIIFAVLDTSVNSDQPGPILATIVSGQFKGARLIGSFNLPSNSDSLVISFNTMSVPGAAKSTAISAYAIDANTAQTALSSRADHHYLLRYGSLFASSFLEGFGNAFQSANTTVTIGGTAGGDNVTVQNGIGRSALQNAVIGMATLGKSWGQAAQQQFSTPTTVEVFAGTPMGILFTQDLTTL